MKIYKTIAKNTSLAYKKAIKEHSVNIQVIYEREILYGFFNRKFVEIAYFEKDLFEIKEKELTVSYDLLETQFLQSYLFKLLILNNFSYELSNLYQDKYFSYVYNERLKNRSFSISKKLIIDFFRSFTFNIAKRLSFENQPLSSSGMILLAPFGFNDEGFLIRLVVKISLIIKDRKFFILNYKLNLNLDNQFDYSNADSLEEIKTALDKKRDCFVIINISKDCLNDLNLQRDLEEITCFSPIINTFLLCPCDITFDKAKSYIKPLFFNSFIFTNYSQDDRLGSMLSIASAVRLKILYLDDTKRLVDVNPEKLTSLLVFR